MRNPVSAAGGGNISKVLLRIADKRTRKVLFRTANKPIRKVSFITVNKPIRKALLRTADRRLYYASVPRICARSASGVVVGWIL